MLADRIETSSNPRPDDSLKSLKGHTHMQYGEGEQVSLPRSIRGSISQTAHFNEDSPFKLLLKYLKDFSEGHWRKCHYESQY